MRPIGRGLLAEGMDLVVGPLSKQNLVAASMSKALIQKGYCVSCLLKPQSDIEAIHRAAKTLDFVRVPAEFEPYYLGRDSREKTIMLNFNDPELPLIVRSSPLSQL